MVYIWSFRVHSSEHGPLVVVYKIDYFVKGSLLSSLVLLNTRVVLLPHSKVLVHNNVRNRNKIVNSISPTNRWADRTNEPRVGTVLECQDQEKWT